MRVLDAAEDRRAFQQQILQDLDAFDALLNRGEIAGDSGEYVGVEQELQFIDERCEPVNAGDKIIQKLKDPVFTEEYARFNFEIALPPRRFNETTLSELAKDLQAYLRQIDEAAAEYGARSILCSILPSLRHKHITEDSLTRSPRYQKLYDLRHRIKEHGEYEYQFHGVDDLVLRDADSMLGGVFTSLQLHWQLSGETAADEYNWSQLIAAPCLAAACCSPLFLGKRLWRETRISLFEQTSDIRRRHLETFDAEPPRASLGGGWIERIADVWRQDLAAYRPAIAPEKALDGEACDPLALPHLQFFNSTVYRWNRLCYGIGPGDGASIRIESRALPAGLTIRDEIANAALWWGLMAAGAERGAGLADLLPFSRVKENFRRAARDGVECQLTWLDGDSHDVRRILLDELIPLAAEKLRDFGVPDPDWQLRPVARRAETGRTASRWMLDSFEHLRNDYDTDESCRVLTRAMAELAAENLPVADWPPLLAAPSRYGRHGKPKETELAPLRPDDSLSLAEHRFQWEETQSLPAFDHDGNQRTLRLLDVHRARQQNLDTVSDALTLTPSSQAARKQETTLPAFERAVPLRRVIAAKNSGAAGPLLIIMAGLHGNEINTLAALDAFLEQAAPHRGDIVGMTGNISALRTAQRYCSQDLNRSFFGEQNPPPPEAQEVADILKTLDAVACDRGDVVLIDLHGTSGHAPPYVSALSNLEAWPLAERLPVPHVTGFEKMFSGTLVEHAASKGWTAATCEIGCIHEPTTVDNGVHFLHLVASSLGVTELSAQKRRRFADALKAHCPTTETYTFAYRHPVGKEDEFRMLPGFVSFQKVQKGERLALDRNGDVRAPCNGRILMPLYQEQGEDGFFIVN